MPEDSNLPHQEDGLRPEGIIDHEQDPPEEVVTSKDYAHIPKNRRALSTSLQNDDKDLQKFLDENSPMKITPPPAGPQETNLMARPKPIIIKKPGKFTSLIKKIFS